MSGGRRFCGKGANSWAGEGVLGLEVETGPCHQLDRQGLCPYAGAPGVLQVSLWLGAGAQPDLVPAKRTEHRGRQSGPRSRARQPPAYDAGQFAVPGPAGPCGAAAVPLTCANPAQAKDSDDDDDVTVTVDRDGFMDEFFEQVGASTPHALEYTGRPWRRGGVGGPTSHPPPEAWSSPSEPDRQPQSGPAPGPTSALPGLLLTEAVAHRWRRSAASSTRSRRTWRR